MTPDEIRVLADHMIQALEKGTAAPDPEDLGKGGTIWDREVTVADAKAVANEIYGRGKDELAERYMDLMIAFYPEILLGDEDDAIEVVVWYIDPTKRNKDLLN